MGGSGHAVSSTTPVPPSWFAGPYEQFYQQANQTLMPGGGFIPYNPAMNPQVAPFTPTQQAGLGGIIGAAGAEQPVAGAGLNQAYQTLSGQFLDPATNPYLQATYAEAARPMIQSYQQSVAPSLMAQAQRAGAFGGSAYDQAQSLSQENLARGLGNLGTDIFGGAYETGRAQQLQTLGMLPSALQSGMAPSQAVLGAGTLEQQQQQAVLDSQRQAAVQQQQYPYSIASQIGDLYGQLTGQTSVVPIKTGALGGLK